MIAEMNFRQPEPNRKIKRTNLPKIAIKKDGSAILGHMDNEGEVISTQEWSQKRVCNAILIRNKCQCKQCDSCLVAEAYLASIQVRQRKPLPKKHR